MSEDFTLYRGEAGAPHLLAFRCAHRGTQLSTGWVEGDDLRCFYHGWKYDSGGQCIEQPAEPQAFCDRIKIKSYPVQEYLGYIFAYLGEGAPPPLPRFPRFESGAVEVHSQYLACNYFQRVENALDSVHTAFVHRYPYGFKYGMVGDAKLRVEESPWGLTLFTHWATGQRAVHHLVMPNVLLIEARAAEEGESPWDLLGWRVPIDDTCHVSCTVDHAQDVAAAANRYWRSGAERQSLAAVASEQGEKVVAGELRIEDVEDRRAIFELQDYVAQVGQGVIADRQAEHAGHSDLAVLAIRKTWTRELQALADGQPLTKWAQVIETDD
jgi:5,5'-dehydrodivanillate O-demethylase